MMRAARMFTSKLRRKRRIRSASLEVSEVKEQHCLYDKMKRRKRIDLFLMSRRRHGIAG